MNFAACCHWACVRISVWSSWSDFKWNPLELAFFEWWIYFVSHFLLESIFKLVDRVEHSLPYDRQVTIPSHVAPVRSLSHSCLQLRFKLPFFAHDDDSTSLIFPRTTFSSWEFLGVQAPAVVLYLFGGDFEYLRKNMASKPEYTWTGSASLPKRIFLHTIFQTLIRNNSNSSLLSLGTIYHTKMTRPLIVNHNSFEELQHYWLFFSSRDTMSSSLTFLKFA